MRRYNTVGMEAAAKTDLLLLEHGSRIEDWHPDGDAYKKNKRRDVLKTLHSLQSKLIHVITEREAEQSILHRRVRGQKNAKKFLVAINSRWQQLDSLVTAYNAELARLPDEGLNLRPLNAKAIRKDGLDHTEIWDVDRLLSSSDWAVYDYVREGIEALFRLRRSAEERNRLHLHSKRTTNWLVHQMEVLLKDTATPVPVLVELVLHRTKIIHSLLKMKGPILDPEDRQKLTGLLAQVKIRREATQTRVQPSPVAPVVPANENLDPAWPKTTEMGVETIEDVDGTPSEDEEREDSDIDEDEDVDCEALAEELAEQLLLQCSREEQQERLPQTHLDFDYLKVHIYRVRPLRHCIP
jgi:hypothetical protein